MKAATALIGKLMSNPTMQGKGEKAIANIKQNTQLTAKSDGQGFDFSNLMQNKPALKALAERFATQAKPSQQDADSSTVVAGDDTQQAQQWLAQLLASPQNLPLPSGTLFSGQLADRQSGAVALPASLLPGLMKQAQQAGGADSQKLLQQMMQVQGGNQPTQNPLSGADKNALVAMMQTLMQQQSPTATALPDTATPLQQVQATLASALNINGLQGSAPKGVRQPELRQSDRPVLEAITRGKVLNATPVNDGPSLPVTQLMSGAQVDDRAANTTLPTLTATLDPQREDWDQQLFSLLKDRIQVQMDGLHQTATIRLDPPSQGKIDISIQFEAGKLLVNINAGQADVYRALQQLSESLRHQLTAQNFVQVQVQVSTGDSSQQQQHQRNTAREQENGVSQAQEITSKDSEGPVDSTLITKV